MKYIGTKVYNVKNYICCANIFYLRLTYKITDISIKYILSINYL